MSDLTEFLLARLAEDEADAPIPSWEDNFGCCMDCGGVGERRWLADCEAKRQLVELHGVRSEIEQYGITKGSTIYWCPTCDHDRDYGHIGGPDEGCETLRILATVYADHADYREDWRP